MRIFWLFNHPAPYKVSFFNSLGEKADLTVYFERYKEKGRNRNFYENKVRSFRAIYGRPIKLGGYDNFSRKPLEYLKKAEDYDIIVINGWRTLTEQMAISYCKRHHIPYVFAINGGILRPSENNLAYAIKHGKISGASLYLSPEENSNRYLEHYGADPSRIRVFTYGSVAKEEILEAPYGEERVAKLRNKLGINGERVFVSAGYFIKRKNLDSLIDIWIGMPKSHHLYLIGEGPEKRHIEHLIQKNDLDNVHILPYKAHPELFRFYRACDGFLFPSNEDIYGHVVTESLSQGLPVFASSRSNAALALIQGKDTGRIIDFSNREEAILALTADIPAEWKTNGIELAKQYTYEASADMHIKIFEEYLKEKRR